MDAYRIVKRIPFWQEVLEKLTHCCAMLVCVLLRVGRERQ